MSKLRKLRGTEVFDPQSDAEYAAGHSETFALAGSGVPFNKDPDGASKRRFANISLNQWMALTPPDLVQAHLNLDTETMAALRKDKQIVV